MSIYNVTSERPEGDVQYQCGDDALEAGDQVLCQHREVLPQLMVRREAGQRRRRQRLRPRQGLRASGRTRWQGEVHDTVSTLSHS